MPPRTPPPRGDHLADFTRDPRVLLLALLALGIGVLSAGAAWVLVKAIALVTDLAFYHRFSAANLSPARQALGAAVIAVPALGGLFIGLMARFGSEQIRGHGIPEALEAILFGQSRMHPKVAILKPISSAVSIGTGGPFGAEGPIIMTGGALGSLIAQWFRLSSAERKTLLAAGAAGGMAAIFAAPVSSVLLAVEVLLFEWRPRSFLPVTVAATTAGALRAPLLGMGPIFPVPPHPAMAAGAWGGVILFGAVGGLAAMLLTALVYGCEDLFHKLPLHWMWWPALGGLIVGVMGWRDPRIFGVGYDLIHDLLLGRNLGGHLPRLLLLKMGAWTVALGSGTSGGVLAPLLILGGTLGALEAHWFSLPDPGLWAMLEMAAVMGGALRAPFTAVVFAVELTQDVSVLPALLATCATAYAVTVFFMRRSILTAKVARRGYHLTCEYGVDPLRWQRVADVMDRDFITVPADLAAADLARRIAQNNPGMSRHRAFPVLDTENDLVGIVTRGDVIRAEAGGEAKTVLQAGNDHPITIFPDEVLETAVAKMLQKGVGRLLVVTRAEPNRVIGYLGRSGLLAAHQNHFAAEAVPPRLTRSGQHKRKPPGTS